MSNVKVNKINTNLKGMNHNFDDQIDFDDDDDLYDDYEQSRWQKGNQRKVLKFKEHKAK